ncbi:MAG TPA: hypothetical protein VM532_18200 [Burkholderiales bacterium]|nr:hypothetical protein [Burkholderiales bacterium]
MAENPQVTLTFPGGCPDCGSRQVDLPQVLPDVGDDFDWNVRDYDSIRLFMLQELAARFTERRRWTPADVEVVVAEALAAQLDKLSDMLDRVAAEFTLDTARRPETVRRLLNLIGYDALGLAKRMQQAPFDQAPPAGDTRSDIERFDQYWLGHPEKMDHARLAGPRAVRTQRRMVTLEDYVTRVEEHPLVERAHAWQTWSGSWPLIRVAVISLERRPLDATGVYADDVWEEIETFHQERDLLLPPAESGASVRSLLHPYIEAYRMAGQAVELAQAVEVGVVMFLSIQVAPNYFQSEIRHAINRVLGTGPSGFFAPGRLRFGEDLWAGDIIQTVMSLDGVINVCLNRFKRIGDRFPDMSGVGRIPLEGLEVAVCDNVAGQQSRGYFRLTLHGGQKG